MDLQIIYRSQIIFLTLFFPSTSVFVDTIVFFNLEQARFANKHPFFWVVILHPIHSRKIYSTDIAMLYSLFQKLKWLF